MYFQRLKDLRDDMDLKQEDIAKILKTKGKISKIRNKEHLKAIEKSKGINPIWYYINELKKEIIYEEKRKNDPFA